MRKKTFCAALLLGICWSAQSIANAQITFVYSQIGYNSTTNTVEGYSATEVDYFSAYYYNAYVESYLNDQFGITVDSGYDEEPFFASVQTIASASEGVVYSVLGYHDVVARYHYVLINKSPEGCYPCDGCNQDCYYYYENWFWYDTLGFSTISPTNYGPWWSFFGEGPETQMEDEEYVDLGSTLAVLQVAASPDHLVVVFDQSGYTNQIGNGAICAANYFMRQVQFRVVSQDSNGAQPVGNVVVRETFDSVTTNSCANGQPSPYPCALTENDGTFIDTISTGCNSVNGAPNCGYDIQWGWYWCGTTNHAIVKLASLNAQVRRDSVTLNGLATPSQWSPGTAFRR